MSLPFLYTELTLPCMHAEDAYIIIYHLIHSIMSNLGGWRWGSPPDVYTIAQGPLHTTPNHELYRCSNMHASNSMYTHRRQYIYRVQVYKLFRLCKTL